MRKTVVTCDNHQCRAGSEMRNPGTDEQEVAVVPLSATTDGSKPAGWITVKNNEPGPSKEVCSVKCLFDILTRAYNAQRLHWVEYQ